MCIYIVTLFYILQHFSNDTCCPFSLIHHNVVVLFVLALAVMNILIRRRENNGSNISTIHYNPFIFFPFVVVVQLI